MEFVDTYLTLEEAVKDDWDGQSKVPVRGMASTMP